MSFLKNLFHKNKKEESVILIDIGTHEVAGAYVQYREKEPPALLYTRSFPIEIRTDEPREQAVLRALDVLGNTLIREGAPELARVTGSGSARSVLVSVDAPWQETKVRVENFDSKEPFLFTRDLITKSLTETTLASPEKLVADESVIGTILNGYATNNPYGQAVHRASAIVLTSLIARHVADASRARLRSLFHTPDIQFIAGSSLRYQTLRALFPHEDDMLILDMMSGPLLSLMLVRKGVFVTLVETTASFEESTWIAAATKELAEIATEYPLPRTLFLLAPESNLPALRPQLVAADWNALWPGENAPKIVPLAHTHLYASVRQMSANPSSITLLLMAIFFKNRRSA